MHSREAKKNTSHGNEVLPPDTTHLIQRPCYQQESPCQDSADNRTTRRLPGHDKETQTEVIWTCLPSIRSGRNYFVRNNERKGNYKAYRKKRWEDNIREWTGLEFEKSQRAVNSRQKRRKLVVKSFVVSL